MHLVKLETFQFLKRSIFETFKTAFDFFFHWAWIKINYYLFQGDLPRLLVQEFKVNFFYNVKSSLIYRLLGFLKNHRGGIKIFL